MRLNWFLRSQKHKESSRFRRVLRAFGPTWVWSPWRRAVQAICLVGFLLLFLYVCLPYTASPARAWHGWLPLEVDARSGRSVVAPEGETVRPVDVPTVYVVDTSSQPPLGLGRFSVEAGGEGKLVLVPIEPLEPQERETLSLSFGPWSLHEHDPEAWPSHYADDLAAKQIVPAELFLAIDPLVGLSTAIAARAWVWSLSLAAVILAVCVLVPRGFCGYLCPLGTLIDLFDWALGRRVKRARVGESGWWGRLKYYVLAAALVAALFGVLVSGFVAAIPVITRACAFLLTPLATAAVRNWHQVPALGAGQYLSIGLFVAVLGLGLLKPRFWCRYVCPTGALFSLWNVFRLTQRKVEATCIGCGKCIEACPFDAIKTDFTTRTADCTFCQTCGGSCPVAAIEFVPRWEASRPKPAGDPTTCEPAQGRRSFLATAVGLTAGGIFGAAAARGIAAAGAGSGRSASLPPVRPPGSVPEREFLAMCIRCGECFQACPNDVLQPLGFQNGLENLWTPRVVANWSGCEPSCNNCGHVCPTGAIRALPLAEKRAARMGLAVVNEAACLPCAGRAACQLCVDECATAGYDAIEFIRVGTEVDEDGKPVEGSGFLAPVVRQDRCVGCGLCQTRCYAINKKTKHLLDRSAIVVEAGDGKEDRLTSGSYAALRDEERRRRQQVQRSRLGGEDAGQDYLPDFLK